MAIVYRLVKGSNLTPTEVDENFSYLEGIVDELVAAGVGNGIDDITIAGGAITFHMTDYSTLGPFLIPARNYNPRGVWLNSMTVATDDLVFDATIGLFVVMIGHETPAAPADFDPNAVDEDDNPLYQLLVPTIDTTRMMRERGEFAGAFAYIYTDVFVSPDHGTILVLSDHISAATLDPGAVDVNDEPLYRRLAGPHFPPVVTEATAARTLTIQDVGKYIRCTAECAITFPPDADVAWPDHCEIHFRQAGDDPVSFVAGAGVTLNPQRDDPLADYPYGTATAWKGAAVTAKRVGANEWDLIGPFGDPVIG